MAIWPTPPSRGGPGWWRAFLQSRIAACGGARRCAPTAIHTWHVLARDGSTRCKAQHTHTQRLPSTGVKRLLLTLPSGVLRGVPSPAPQASSGCSSSAWGARCRRCAAWRSTWAWSGYTCWAPTASTTAAGRGRERGAVGEQCPRKGACCAHLSCPETWHLGGRERRRAATLATAAAGLSILSV